MAGNIYHEWDGTTLIITSDSGTSSADLKGNTGVRGCQGASGRVSFNELTEDQRAQLATEIASEVTTAFVSSLTFDETPTEGSKNAVTSNGIKAYVDNQIAEAHKPITDFAAAYKKGYNFNGKTVIFNYASYHDSGTFKITFANGTYLYGEAGGGINFRIYNPYNGETTEITNYNGYIYDTVSYTFRDGTYDIGSDCSITGFYFDPNYSSDPIGYPVSANEFASNIFITFNPLS